MFDNGGDGLRLNVRDNLICFHEKQQFHVIPFPFPSQWNRFSKFLQFSKYFCQRLLVSIETILLFRYKHPCLLIQRCADGPSEAGKNPDNEGSTLVCHKQPTIGYHATYFATLSRHKHTILIKFSKSTSGRSPVYRGS